jgi:transcriptional regulator with XRE-family HTH domain
MQRYTGHMTKRMMARRLHTRTWQRSHPRDSRPTNGTYGLTMAEASQVSRVRFARWVARVLAEARGRGLTDRVIAEKTGVGMSTFHRWARGEIGRIRAFCAGLGVPARDALAALGMADGRDNPEPAPAMDPDVRRILRALADPNVSDQDKLVIREMLRMIATRTRQSTRQTNA